jgi:hypothetical protein
MGPLIHLAILTMGQPHPPSLSLLLTFLASVRDTPYTTTLPYYHHLSFALYTPSLVTSNAPDPPLHTAKRLICCSCRRLSVSAGCMLLVTSTRSFEINVTGLFIFDYVVSMCVVNGARRWTSGGSIIYFQVGQLY